MPSDRYGNGPPESARRGGIPEKGPRCPNRMIGPISDPLYVDIIDWFEQHPGVHPWRRFVSDVLWPALPHHKLWRIKAKVVWLARLEVLWIDAPIEVVPFDNPSWGQPVVGIAHPWTVELVEGWTVARWEAERDGLREWLRREQSIERFGHPDELAKRRRPKMRKVRPEVYRGVLEDAERMRRAALGMGAGEWMPPVTYGAGRRRRVRQEWLAPVPRND